MNGARYSSCLRAAFPPANWRVVWDDLPPPVAAFAEDLTDIGFAETRRAAGTMDSGLIAYRRTPVEIGLIKDRGFWAVAFTADGWRDSISYGFGLSAATGDVFPPRSSRDAARDYDVPGVIRWLIRRLLSAGFSDVCGSDTVGALRFRRESLEVRLRPDRSAWAVELVADGWSAPLTLPGFHGEAALET